MEKYIGVKVITAEPCPAWKDAGGHKVGDAGYKVIYEDGYESWSPKDVFEKAYHKFTGMTFGQAIEAMKIGKKATRKGWNGKGMYIFRQKGYPDGIPCNKQTAEAVGINEGDLFKCQPYLQMKCADNTFQMWVASQTDILAEDWEVIG